MSRETISWSVQFDHSRDRGTGWLDWVGIKMSTLEAAEAEMDRLRAEYPHYGVRIVRRTLVEEIVAEAER